MHKKRLALALTVLLAAALMAGCGFGGFKNIMPSKEAPPLDDYSAIVLVCADVEKPSGKYEKLTTLLTYAVGTKLEVRSQDKNWIFDKTQEIQPVSDKMKELNISAKDVFMQPQAATKLAEALQADIVIAWQLLEEPRFTKEESGKITEDKSKVSATGTARYYTIHQTAMLKADAKMITKASENIWDGRLIGYQKYATQYGTGNPPKSQREETMYSDVRKDFVQKLVDKIYPAAVAEG